ncbi:hypothetical protein M9Y10_035536 [Tritrichomonas musculus]|uniref:Surface antigen BspA-like n=1 Tax=Tritrichomonas musculus TaxID=1915356 RepID=A0ABR2KIZ5_9EUKA
MSLNQQKKISTPKVVSNDIEYLINEEEKTAGIISCKSSEEQLIIPTTIIDNSKEYDITIIFKQAFKFSKINSIRFAADSKLQEIDEEAFIYSNIESIEIPSEVKRICKNAFFACERLRKIEIPNDSKLQTIESNAFSYTPIESIYLPSKVVELHKEWCYETSKLNKVIVSPDNPYFKTYEDKMIIGKKNIESTNYDQLIFCARNVETITIPNFIECICTYAFFRCEQLRQIEISSDSKLKTIEKCAFSYTPIESIYLPSKVVELHKEWCYETSKLNKVIISPDNPYFKIYEDKMIIGKKNIESTNYDQLIFCARNVETITIPNFIECICTCSFDNCKQIQKVEFLNDSKLEIIEDESFFNSSIRTIKISSKVTKIGSNAFFKCEKLQRIEISNDSELQIIGDFAFAYSPIRSFTFPPEVTKIAAMTFSHCKYLYSIEIPHDSKLQMICDFAFRDSTIERIKIPSRVTQIGNFAFYCCEKLQRVEITNDSELQIIESYAFHKTSIESIVIPSKITSIAETAFLNCNKLQIIEFSDKSMFKLIGNGIIMIPVTGKAGKRTY